MADESKQNHLKVSQLKEEKMAYEWSEATWWAANVRTQTRFHSLSTSLPISCAVSGSWTNGLPKHRRKIHAVAVLSSFQSTIGGSTAQDKRNLSTPALYWKQKHLYDWQRPSCQTYSIINDYNFCYFSIKLIHKSNKILHCFAPSIISDHEMNEYTK